MPRTRGRSRRRSRSHSRRRSTVHIRPPRALAPAPTVALRPREGLIQVRLSQLQLAIDSTGRALNAAHQANRLCLAAARAFNDEAVVMEEARMALQSLLPSVQSAPDLDDANFGFQ